MSIPDRIDKGKTVLARGGIYCKDALPNFIWDSVFLKASEDVKISYIEDTARIHSPGTADGMILPQLDLFGKGALISYDINQPGVIPSSEDGSRAYIELRIRCERNSSEHPVRGVDKSYSEKKYDPSIMYDPGLKSGNFLQRCSSLYAYYNLMHQQNGKNMAAYYQAVTRSFDKYFYQEDDIDIEVGIDARKFWYKDFFDCRRYSVSYEEAKKATIAAFYDWPLAYFAYTYTVTGNIERKLSLYAVDEAFRLGSSRKKYSKLIENEIMSIVQAIPSECSGQEAAQAVYDIICLKGKYDSKMGTCGYIDVYAHSVASYAEKHMAVCEGLAKTFQAVMLYLGYECLTVSGYVYNNANSHSDRHAWNMLKVDNLWHVIDVTAGIKGYKPVFMKNPEMYREYGDEDKSYDLYRYQPESVNLISNSVY